MIMNFACMSCVKIDCRIRSTFDKTMYFEIGMSGYFWITLNNLGIKYDRVCIIRYFEREVLVNDRITFVIFCMEGWFESQLKNNDL